MHLEMSSDDWVLEDIRLFIGKFLEKESHQYSDFILLWNELNFAHFYWYVMSDYMNGQLITLIKAPL